MNLNLKLKNPNLIQSGLFINGNFINSSQKTFSVTNPATGEVLTKVSKANLDDLKLATNQALFSQKNWALVNPKARSQILLKIYHLILENADDLATILTLEQGKPLAEAKGEALYAASYFEWYANEIRRVYAKTIPANSAGQKLSVSYEPIGVAAIITPWNFPIAMLARKIAPALAAGCAIIAKPASLTPLSANALAYLCNEAGLNAGLLNIVHGNSRQIGEFFCHNFSIRKLSFTGSTEVGVWLYENSANSMKRLSLELGGNAPFIVCKDANLDQAVKGILQSKFRNSGQTCVCTNRLIVDSTIKEQLISKLIPAIKNLKLGSGLNSTTDLGPLIEEKAVKHIQELLLDATNQGAKILCGGDLELTLGPLFFQATLIDCGKNTNLRLFHEEIFGPVLAIYSFDEIKEAVNLANNTNYGLASYVYSTRQSTIDLISQNLEYGMVGINCGLISAENIPFGGIKMSGIGREGGEEGIREYLNLKYTCLNQT